MKLNHRWLFIKDTEKRCEKFFPQVLTNREKLYIIKAEYRLSFIVG